MTAPRCSDRAAAELAARQAIRRRIIKVRAQDLRRGEVILTTEGWLTLQEVGHAGQVAILDCGRVVIEVHARSLVPVRQA